jgi:hypothetical protein
MPIDHKHDRLLFFPILQDRKQLQCHNCWTTFVTLVFCHSYALCVTEQLDAGKRDRGICFVPAYSASIVMIEIYNKYV